LNSETIGKIGNKSKLNGEMIGKIWNKSKLNSDKIWIVWKKNKLNSEKIWKTDFSFIISISFPYFLPYCQYLIPIQLAFLPYFPSHFTILFCIFQIFSILKMRKKIMK
jgi:hypothetical protein